MLFGSKLDDYVRLQHGRAGKTYKISPCFDEIMQKIWFKLGVGKLKKILSIDMDHLTRLKEGLRVTIDYIRKEQ